MGVQMSGSPNRRKTILIAEDDKAIRTLLERALSQEYDIVLAEDGTSALKKAASAPRPDLLMLDVMMPGVDGLSVATQAKALPQLKKVPVIFITARTQPMDVVKGINAGARHYITKPFKIAEVLTKVKKAIGD